MNIEAFLICDAATDQNGKLNVLGAFDSLLAQKFPVIHPYLAVALRLRFFREENGDHQLELHFLDDDANEIVPKLEANIHVAVTNSEQSTVFNLVLNLQGVKFPHKGDYSVNLEVDGEEKCVLPVFVKQAS